MSGPGRRRAAAILGAMLFLPALTCRAEDAGTIRAVVVSDLHYTREMHEGGSLAAGAYFAAAITDTLAAEVISLHPDVFIMTGDNTNNGREEDARSLVSKMQRIKDAGIQVILVPGNHDFNHADMEAYAEIYGPLADPSEEDPASLSYAVVMDDYLFLAMDDSSLTLGGYGQLREETVAWLLDMLSSHPDKHAVFLSHHNVLAGGGSEGARSYQIQNPELKGMLEEAGVSLILSGHLHSGMILQEGEIFEIVSPMLFSGKHVLGLLTLDEDGASYETRPMDLARFGDEGLAEALEETEQQGAQRTTLVMERILEEEEVPEADRPGILDLISRFFASYEAGTMGDDAASIRDDPYYGAMLEALWERNYGPWMKSAVEDDPRNADQLTLEW